MSKHLAINGFGPVTKADIEIRQFNLLIGEQSIGKSTIAKLITILTDVTSLSQIVANGYKSWESLTNEYNLSYCISSESYSILYVLDEKQLHFALNISKNSVSYRCSNDGKDVTSKRETVMALLATKQLYHGDNLLDMLHGESRDKQSQSILEYIKDSLYIPAERIIFSVIGKLQPAIMLAEAVVPKHLTRFLVELNNAKEKQQTWKVPLLGISYQWKDQEDYFLINGSRRRYPMRVASSGIQSFVPLYLVFRYALSDKEYSSFVVEEPECNLFPDKQVELLKLLLHDTLEHDRSLTITTHSPYLLSALNNSLFAGSLVKRFGKSAQEAMSLQVPACLPIEPDKCSVYSLGESVNDGVFCRSIIDADTSMIDANSLDGASIIMAGEFEKLENLYLSLNSKGQ